MGSIWLWTNSLKCLTWALVCWNLRDWWANWATLARSTESLVARDIIGLLGYWGGCGAMDWLLTLVKSCYTCHLLSLSITNASRILLSRLERCLWIAVDIQCLDDTINHLLGRQVVVRLSLHSSHDGLAHSRLWLSNLTTARVLAKDELRFWTWPVVQHWELKLILILWLVWLDGWVASKFERIVCLESVCLGLLFGLFDCTWRWQQELVSWLCYSLINVAVKSHWGCEVSHLGLDSIQALLCIWELPWRWNQLYLRHDSPVLWHTCWLSFSLDKLELWWHWCSRHHLDEDFLRILESLEKWSVSKLQILIRSAQWNCLDLLLCIDKCHKTTATTDD